ncbi:outer membrane porin, OprD family [Pseudomonas putida]|nr:outer membrane porin, OprD family [Pseudomonas putida]
MAKSTVSGAADPTARDTQEIRNVEEQKTCTKSSLALAVALGVLAQTKQALPVSLKDSKTVAQLAHHVLQRRQTAKSGIDQKKKSGQRLQSSTTCLASPKGTVGFGVDVQALWGIHLDGGRGSRPDAKQTPSSQATPMVRQSTTGHALVVNAKARFSKDRGSLR